MKMSTKIKCSRTGQKYEVHLDVTEDGIFLSDKDGVKMGNIIVDSMTDDEGTIDDKFWIVFICSDTGGRNIDKNIVGNGN